MVGKWLEMLKEAAPSVARAAAADLNLRAN